MIECSICARPTDNDHEYTKGLYICSICADEIEDQVMLTCNCGRQYYRRDAVTNECMSCYELRLEYYQL